MRKYLISIISCCLALSLCACGSSTEANIENTESESSAEGEELEYSDEETADISSLYGEAVELENEQDYAGAAIAFGKIIDYEDSRDRSYQNWEKVIKYDTISCSGFHIVALKNNGTVVATGLNSNGQCDLSDWGDIISVAAGPVISIGLKSDHTVISTSGSAGIDLSEWQDIVYVTACAKLVIGLKADGTLIYAELREGAVDEVIDSFNANRLKDIVAIDGDPDCAEFIALTLDNNIVSVYEQDDFGQTKVGSWGSKIIDIDAGTIVAVGLTQNGRVEYAGFENTASDAASTITGNTIKGWSDVVRVAAGSSYVVCLKSDGTLTAVDNTEIYYDFTNRDYAGTQGNVYDWTDVVDVIACKNMTVALRSDGIVLATGNDNHGACDVSEWTDIRIPV